jgi:hypothetical protein
MAKLCEEVVHVEDLRHTLFDLNDIFSPQCPHWAYVWYKIEGNREEVYLVAYSSRAELIQQELNR